MVQGSRVGWSGPARLGRSGGSVAKKSVNLSISNEIARCAKCGTCRSVCPVFKELRDETLVARSRIALFEALIKGDAPALARFKQAVATCLMCLKCREKCPSLVATDEIFIRSREWFNDKQGLPFLLKFAFRFIIPYRWLYDFIIRFMGILGRFLNKKTTRSFIRHLPLIFIEPFKRLPELAGKSALCFYRPPPAYPRPPLIAIFVGCLINYVYPEIYTATTRLLDRLDISYIIPTDQVCCGTPLLLYGDRNNARRLAIRNLKVLTRDKPEAIITMCASCGRMLKEEYPKLQIPNSKSQIPIMDIMEYLNKYSMSLSRQGRGNLKTAYHQPCHFTWTESGKITRRVLADISDYINTDEEDLCCGGGGSFAFREPLISDRIGQHKVLSYKESGVDAVVTNCPGCLMQLKYLINQTDRSHIKAYHIVELLDKIRVK